MLDLETLSTAERAVVLSIGTFWWDTNVGIKAPTQADLIQNHTAGVFHYILDIEQQPSRHISTSTVTWWMKQSPEARRLFIEPRHDVVDTLQRFTKWYKDVAPDGCYAKPSTFDFPILRSLFVDCKLNFPIHYTKQWCVRTLIEFSHIPEPPMPQWLVPHNALHDCIRQAIWVQAIYDSY